MTRKCKNKETGKAKHKVPEFDEAILNPVGDEVVRAVRTTPNQESVFEKYCKRRGVTVYLPLRRVWKVHNINRNGKSYSYSQEVLRPLFTSYVFVKMAEPLLRTLHESRVVAQILLEHNQERFLEELRVVRTCETVGFEQELEVHKEIAAGDRFLITSGIWEGVEGRLTQKDNCCKWTVEIEFCQQFVTTTIDPRLFKMTPLDD